MKKTVFLLLLLTGLLVPWATQAQTPAILYGEGFESTIQDNNGNYGLPEGWSRDGTYSNSWGVREGSQWAYEGDYYMQSGNGGGNSGKKLMSPNLAEYLSSANSAELRFAFQQPLSEGYGPAHLRVFYRTSNTDPWLQIWEYSETVTDWQLAQGIILPDVHNITSSLDYYQIAFDMQTDYPGCCVFLDDVQIVPADKIAIGGGVATSNRIPMGIGNNVYESLSEQIYTSDELGDAGTILSIDFYGINNYYNYSNEPSDVTRGLYGGIDVYMVHTNSTAFQTDVNGFIETESWIGVAETNRVFQGRVVIPFGESWTTITLDTPFNYNGTDNVLLVVDDNSGYLSQNVTFRTFSTSDVQSIYNTSGNDYYSFNPTTGHYGNGGGACRCKNQIRLLKVTCIPPAGLVASNVTNTSATLSWTERGNATNWVVEYADNIGFVGATSVTVNSNPTTNISGLSSGSTYFARVKANCGGDDLSPWSNPLVFTTDFCTPAEKCEIFYELTFDYAEPVGMNGDGINVVDVETDIVIARLTIGNYLQDGNTGEEFTPNTPDETDGLTYARGSFSVCNGRDIRFEWMNGDWVESYCSFVFYDADFNPISGLSGMGSYFIDDENNYTEIDDVEYPVSCTPSSCPRPTHVAVNYEGGTTATVTWDNVGSDYDVGLIDHGTGDIIDIFNSITNSYTITDLELGTTYDVQVVTVCDRGDVDEESSHVSRTVTFTTDLCMPEDQCAISYELRDSYGDGWNGAEIIVLAVDPTDYSETVIATWTIPSNNTGGGSIEDEKSGDNVETDGSTYARGTLGVCDGSEIMFRWQNGGCDGECSFTIFDPSGTVIFSGNGGDYGMWGGDMKSGEENLPFIASMDVNCSAVGIGANSWYAISAYTHDDGEDYLSFSNASSLIPPTGGEDYIFYDLYRYDEATATWENYKANHDDFDSFEKGRGYIYRTTLYTQMALGGTENTGAISYSLSYTNDGLDNDLKGFNLIGNPYPHSIVKGTDFAATGLATGYYSLAPDGSWRAHLDSDPIGKGQAVLVKVSSDVSMSFTDNAVAPADPDEKGSRVNDLQFTVTGGGYEDVAYAIFNPQSSSSKSDNLPKFGHLNAEAPSLSIVQGESDYAVATFDEGTASFPLKFRSTVTGNYSLAVNAELGFDYLHLIDHATGMDIDLLRQPNYMFTHAVGQSLANRFTVKLSPYRDSDNGIFAYPNGDRIVVEGTGTLQVYDVLGRQLIVREIESQASIHNSQFPSAGVYILRLNGKSQKLVIK